MEKQERTKKKGFANVPVIRFFVNSEKVWQLVLKCVLVDIIWYAWVWIAGLVFEQWLNQISSVTRLVIFIVACVLLAIGLAITVWAIVRFVKHKKNKI